MDFEDDPPVALDDTTLLGAAPSRSAPQLPQRETVFGFGAARRHLSEQFRNLVDQLVEVWAHGSLRACCLVNDPLSRSRPNSFPTLSEQDSFYKLLERLAV